MTALAELTTAQKALAEIETPADAKDLYDKLEALSQYARRVRLDTDKQNEIAETKLLTAHRGGRLLSETVVHHPGKSHDATLSDLGFTKSTSSRWQRLAKIPESELVSAMRELAESGEEVTFAAFLSRNDRQSLTSSDSDEWYTPLEYIESARRVLGEIDLDPASCSEANETVRAKTIYTAEDDGLGRPWFGRVYTNPPYRNLCPKFMDKLRQEYEASNIEAGIAFINAYSTETRWFQPLFDYHICFVAGRVLRIKPGGGVGPSPTFGSAFVYLGPDNQGFADEFGQYGAIVTRHS